MKTVTRYRSFRARHNTKRRRQGSREAIPAWLSWTERLSSIKWVKLVEPMDRKADGFAQKCALDECEGPLVNYKDGRFCQPHLNLRDVCGIVPCGLPVCHPGALTYATESHIRWQRQYENRFPRLFSGSPARNLLTAGARR